MDLKKTYENGVIFNNGYNSALNDVQNIIEDTIKKNKAHTSSDIVDALNSIITITHMDRDDVQSWAKSIRNNKEKKSINREDEIATLLKKLFDLI